MPHESLEWSSADSPDVDAKSIHARILPFAILEKRDPAFPADHDDEGGIGTQVHVLVAGRPSPVWNSLRALDSSERSEPDLWLLPDCGERLASKHPLGPQGT